MKTSEIYEKFTAGRAFVQQYINGICYHFVEMDDGWIAIFRREPDGSYTPVIQALNMKKAISYCNMIEPVTVPMDPIV